MIGLLCVAWSDRDKEFLAWREARIASQPDGMETPSTTLARTTVANDRREDLRPSPRRSPRG